MNTLILVRHAKSSWSEEELSDYSRPLNARGMRDAPAMGKWLADTGWLPETWASSDALRAKETAIAMMQAAGQEGKDLLLIPALYHASPEALLDYICEIPPKVSSLLLVGHNPGLTALNRWLGFKSLDNLPTCGLVLWQGSGWGAFSQRKVRYITHQFPRMLMV